MNLASHKIEKRIKHTDTKHKYADAIQFVCPPHHYYAVEIGSHTNEKQSESAQKKNYVQILRLENFNVFHIFSVISL